MSDRSTSYPYDTIAYITVTLGTSGFRGSGVLISPDEVLTASHVVYQPGVGVASNIVVSPGYDVGVAPFNSSSGTYVHSFPVGDANENITLNESQQDYAVIHLASPFWDLGTMGIQPDFPGGQATLSGYPVSAGLSQVDSVQTVVRNPSFSLLDAQALGHGSSGGPVWINSAAGPMVVGIISSGSQTTSDGYNTLITSAALSNIISWVALDDKRLHATSTDDFNGDGYSDVAWSKNGSIQEWAMAGGNVIGGGAVAPVDPSWSFLGSGDFQGLGRSDTLWRDHSGLIYEKQMNGSAVVTPLQPAGRDWHLLAVGDFNGTGKSGLLWQNDDGSIVTWQMDGASVIGGSKLDPLNASWRFLAAGDLEGKGTADIVWEDASGTVVEWQLGQGKLVGAAIIHTVDSSTRLFAAGDFNGDGKTDLMWQQADGAITEWAMNGSTILGASSVGTLTPGDWSVVGTGDYNRDGHSDLMLRNAAGQLTEWAMNGSTVTGATNVTAMDPGWKSLT